MAARKKTTRKQKATPNSAGLTPAEVADAAPPAAVAGLEEEVVKADGRVLCRYRDPLGGHWLVLAVVPTASVEPTPFQRDLSDTHVKRLEDVIGKVGSFLDPVIAVAAPEAEGPVRFWTPNGYHRLSALKRMGVKSVTLMLSP